MTRLLALLRDPDRPLVLGVLFWLVFVLVVVRYFTHFADAEGGSVPSGLFDLNIAVLLGLWLILPWDPSASRLRKLAAPGFLLASFTLGVTGSATVHLPLILLGFAVVALVYGLIVAGTAVVVLGAVVIVTSIWLSPYDLLRLASELAVLVLGAAFALGMASATLEARRRRAESDGLLQRVRELTVAEERARMARDMHDSIGHHLTIIKIGLENAERFRERRPEAAWDEVRQSKDLTVQALVETRRWVRALRPLDLDGRVGSVALERLARSFDGSGVAIDFEVGGAERRLDADAELTLYRVLQEGLTNVLRHSEAPRVHIRLAFDDAGVTLVIRDNGHGTDSGPGFGLTSLTERTAALGGMLHTQNVNGGGFELRAELPVAVR